MKYYAHYGHQDFILCLGYGADAIKNYFLNYNECLSNDFVLSQGGKNLQLLASDIHEWKITFVDTGIASNIGQRLKAAEKYLAGEDVFLANYGDGLTDAPLPAQLDHFRQRGKVASLLCVKPNLSYHFVSTDKNDLVENLTDVRESQVRINGGYFIFKKDIFTYIHAGEDLLYEPFQRLTKEGNLAAYKYDGFWVSMDTFKDKQMLDELHSRGNAPWEVWKQATDGSAPPEDASASR
jgi:glucose-1-phosphate cytidylyltransferase